MLHDNNLTELDLSGCPDLKTLYCSNNQLTHFDFTQVPKMNHLVIAGNPYEKLDVSMLTGLNYFNFGGENMTEAPIMSANNQSITGLSSDGGKFESIDLSILPNLETLQISGGAIQSIDITGHPKLQEVNLYSTQIEGALDLSDLQDLTLVRINENSNLTSLSTANCANLEKLYCYGNGISSLDISYCPKMEFLTANNNNALKTLNIAGTGQVMWDFYDYQLISITLSEADYNKAKFPGWGRYDPDVYRSPTCKGGWQYPQYIIVP